MQIPRPAQLRGNESVLPNNIRLDSEGDCIISLGVFAELQEAFQMLGMPSVFLVLDEVKKPPTLVLGGPAGEQKRVFLLHDGVLCEQPPKKETLHVASRR